jgi:putative Holliday junction resolvase
MNSENALASTGRIVALDIGDARIGVAISDPTGLIATPHSIIVRKQGDPAGKIAQLVQIQGSVSLLIGFPRNMDGSLGPQAIKVQRFANELRRLLPYAQINYWDERRTTMEARANRITTGKKKSQRAAPVDHEAAAVLLQSYLDHLRQQRSRSPKP